MTSIISGPSERRLVFTGGRAHPELTEAIAQHLGIELLASASCSFANGELYVRFGESVRGADCFVLQSHASPINDAIMEQLLMVDSLKRASAKRITAVMPCYGYAR